MIKAYRDYWKGYFDFSGRTSVSGYWWFVLANFLVIFILSLVQSLLILYSGDQTAVSYLLSFQLINILPSLAIVVRRLRDAGLSWTNIFWTFLPLAGPIILIVKLCKPSVGPTYPNITNIRQKSPVELGPGYMPAAILFLWNVLYEFAYTALAGAIIHRNVFWWLSQLSILALAIILFTGKKNFGLLIPSGIEFLITLKNMFPRPSIPGIIYLAAWIAMYSLMIITIFKLSQNKTLLTVLTYLPAGLFLANSLFYYIFNLTHNQLGGGYFFFVTLSLSVGVLWALTFLFFAKSLTRPPVDIPSTHQAVYSSTYGVQPLVASPYNLPLPPAPPRTPDKLQNVQTAVFRQTGQTDYEEDNVSCKHDWHPLKNSWSERCDRCGKVEPAKFRQRVTGLAFPMACIPDNDLDIIMTALQMKSMIRSSINEHQNEFCTLNDKLRSDREYMINKNDWNSVFLALSTYGSTSPAECPPIFASLLIPDKQQRVKTFLFERWMSMM